MLFDDNNYVGAGSENIIMLFMAAPTINVASRVQNLNSVAIQLNLIIPAIFETNHSVF